MKYFYPCGFVIVMKMLYHVHVVLGLDATIVNKTLNLLPYLNVEDVIKTFHRTKCLGKNLICIVLSVAFKGLKQRSKGKKLSLIHIYLSLKNMMYIIS